MTRTPSIGAAALQRLLVLARDFLQAPDFRSIMALVGPAVQELLLPDGALLLVTRGEAEEMVEFDRGGCLHPAQQSSVLHRRARLAMKDRTPVLLPEVVADLGLPASLLAFPFPPLEPVGVLAALWYRRGCKQPLHERIAILHYLGELTGAALGNAAFRQMLEQRAGEAAASREPESPPGEAGEEETERIALTDVATGMLNRRGFFLRAEQSFKLARRRRVPSSLIFTDIEGSGGKVWAGEEEGERFVQEVARILRRSLRDSDVVARLGGGEFAVFTVDSAHPEVILARLQRHIEICQRQASPSRRPSFSTGIVQCDPGSELNLTDYLAQADRLMCEQRRGRP